MKVTDDGIGFTGNNGKRSFGLQTMHERALTVGGELKVHSTPGNGTAVECRFPCIPEGNLRKQNLVFQ
jgi:NarL family two-component system sensor histidine kinase LiaS